MTESMLEIPEELKVLVPALRGVIDAVKVQVERGRTGGPVDYARFQREMVERLGDVERRADEVALSALDVDVPRVWINRELHLRVVRSATAFMGLAGPAHVERTLYRPAGRRNAPVVDLRWQMVLGCLGAASPAFSQGGLQAFRDRMIAHDMDRVLLERTVALVRSGAITQAEGRSVSKALRVAIDSRPLSGAGRVEDTINLLGHAARSLVRLASKLMDCDPEEICRKAGIPLLLAPSIKAGLDIDWSDPKQKAMAVEVVERQVSSLQRWLDCRATRRSAGRTT